MLLSVLAAGRGQRKSLMRCALESAMLSLVAAGGSRPKLSIKCNGELGRQLSSEVLALQAGGPELASPAST